MKKYKIAQVGAFDMENYGDLLFNDVFEIEIEKRLEIEEIVLFAPKACTKAFSPEKEVYSVIDFEKTYLEKRFDAVVIGGGDLIHFEKINTLMPNISDHKMLYESFYMWIIPIVVSIKYNIPVIFNAPGVPLRFLKEEHEFVRNLLNQVDYISVRDPISKKYLEETGIKGEKVIICPDTVIYMMDCQVKCATSCKKT